jgi:hypothetical protein
MRGRIMIAQSGLQRQEYGLRRLREASHGDQGHGHGMSGRSCGMIP